MTSGAGYHVGFRACYLFSKLQADQNASKNSIRRAAVRFTLYAVFQGEMSARRGQSDYPQWSSTTFRGSAMSFKVLGPTASSPSRGTGLLLEPAFEDQVVG
jgi:hypothetical protein